MSEELERVIFEKATTDGAFATAAALLLLREHLEKIAESVQGLRETFDDVQTEVIRVAPTEAD